MSKKKEKTIDFKKIPEEEKLKYEIAEELGLLDKVKKADGEVFLLRRPGESVG